MRQTSQQGIELIKHFEGLELESYQDVAGIWTIGYGHTGPEVGPDQTISESEAERLLKEDLDRFERGVSQSVKADITQNQFDALVSLSYNIGVRAFKNSTALKRLNKGDYQGAAEAITWWNKATINGKKQVVAGLARRRSAESALFMQDVDAGGSNADTVHGNAVEENVPRRKNPLNSRTVGGATTAGTAGAVGAGSAYMNGRGGGDAASEEPAAGAPGDSGAGDAPGQGAPSADELPPGAASDEVSDEVSGEASGEMSDEASDEDSGGTGGGEGEAPGEAQTTGGCLDPDTGEYLLPAEAEAGMPLGEPIDGDTTDPVLEEVDPPICTEGQLAELRQPEDLPLPDKGETWDAVAIGAGAVAVLAAIYVIGARLDDWFKFRR